MGAGSRDQAIESLETAFRAVLGENFEESVRELVEVSEWYREFLDVSEAFRLWVCDNVHRPHDPQWVFQPLRASERKLLSDRLGVERSSLVGRTPGEIADMCLSAVGLPSSQIRGLEALRTEWESILDLVVRSEDEKGASRARQQAERYLRALLYFYCFIGHSSCLIDIVRDPGSLRVPTRLQGAVHDSAGREVDALLEALRAEGWADLGFLTIALRKFSKRLEQSGARHVSGKALELFDDSERGAFDRLSRALQPYTHDRPGSLDTRQEELEGGIRTVREVIRKMVQRGVVPNQLLVIETCESVMGPVFLGLGENYESRHLVSEEAPPLGSRIWFVPSADREWARCAWSPVPWKELS